MGGYVRYTGGPERVGPTGWDAWAADYGRLGRENPVYDLGKRLLHGLVDEVVPPPRGREAWALDFNCGAGDDVGRLLVRNWSVVGCDGSPGMLGVAAAKGREALAFGRLELWEGFAEDLEAGSFEGRAFQLIFSTTGGFTYLDDAAFVRAHRVLAGMLAPEGVMVIAHLTPFCVAESLYHFARLSPGAAVKRWRGDVPIQVRGQPMLMRLRSPGRIRRLLAGVVRIERLVPLLACTPPFQTGFRPGPRALAALEACERAIARTGALAQVADQVVCVARRA
jgi:hypothetical protein